MKLRCDVCETAEAAVFCTADEAALCNTCDSRVHHANKLASKHHRFSLLHHSSKQHSPLCDICQDKRAFMFCHQDRALLCGDCDVPVHTANDHTKKHDRFLVSGFKLSATSSLCPPLQSSSTSATLINDQGSFEPSMKEKSVSVSPTSAFPPLFTEGKIGTAREMVKNNGFDNLLAREGGSTGVPEYLMKMLPLPGWHVDDFLDSASLPFGFSKAYDGTTPFLDTEIDRNSFCSFPSDSLGIWVPQAPQTPLYQAPYPSRMVGQNGMEESIMEIGSNKELGDRRWADDGCTVPQISPQYIGFKR